MLLRTHLAFAFLFILLFISHVESKFVFVIMVLVATVIPDMDSSYSSSGRNPLLRPFQFFVKHRGVVHSFTLAIVIAVLIAFFWPVASFGFFMGYSVHIICDSFTREGVQPFWPLKFKSKGFLRTGGRTEEILFLSLILVDVVGIFVLFIF